MSSHLICWNPSDEFVLQTQRVQTGARHVFQTVPFRRNLHVTILNDQMLSEQKLHGESKFARTCNDPVVLRRQSQTLIFIAGKVKAN